MGSCRRDAPRARDAEWFDRLFREYGDRIFRYCVRRTGDPVAADDIRSAVFYEAWRRRDEVDLRTRAALPWLYGVAANLLRNHARAGRRRRAAFSRLPRPRVEADISERIADQIDASARAEALVEVLNALPSGEREVVLLCLVEDRSYEAAASALGLPVGTIRSRLFRARRRLSGPQ